MPLWRPAAGWSGAARPADGAARGRIAGARYPRGRQVGLAERILAGAQAVWPLAVVLACRLRQSRARMRRTSQR